eukprot:6952255-Prymnesium_polylepis.2
MKDRDRLEEVFRSWAEDVDFDMVRLRDERLRAFYKTRYDARANVLDWDYTWELSPIASIVHKLHFRDWRLNGVLFEVRDSAYVAPNRTLASYAYGREKGSSIARRGYWGDVRPAKTRFQPRPITHTHGPACACAMRGHWGGDVSAPRSSDRVHAHPHIHLSSAASSGLGDAGCQRAVCGDGRHVRRGAADGEALRPAHQEVSAAARARARVALCTCSLHMLSAHAVLTGGGRRRFRLSGARVRRLQKCRPWRTQCAALLSREPP